MEAPLFDWQCKLILIGDGQVGKTCVMRRFTNDEFSTSYLSTIGIDFKVHTVKVGDKVIKVQIWDTAGQERFQSLTTAYYRGAKGVLIVYDITNEASFRNVEKWLKRFQRWAGDDVQTMLLGNKCDMESKRQVSKQVGEKLAKEQRMYFAETSAKENINVHNSFMGILTKIVENHFKRVNEESQNENEDMINLRPNNYQQKQSPNCCKK